MPLSQEERILLAIEAINSGTVPSERKAAEQFNVPRTTLRDRKRGLRSIQELHQTQQRLTIEEEEAIKRSATTLHSWGWPSTYRYLRGLATGLLLAKRDPQPLGKHWHEHYLARHPELKSIWSRSLDQSRKDAISVSILEHWFKLYEQTITRFGITATDQYNMDEKGFMKGIGQEEKVIIPVDEEEAWSTQPGNREWVSIIACISSDGYSLPCFFIFKGKQIQHAWLHAQVDERSVLQVSPNGWTSQAIALDWLKHFDAYTKSRLQGTHRLLILDGHTSHVSLPFIEFCEQNRIIPLCLPPHSTHVLQPLDIGLFAPLAKAYKKRIQDHALFGAERISNEQFLTLFQSAFEASFTRANILSAWKATGLQPFDSSHLISKFRPIAPIASLTSSAGNKIDVAITEPDLAARVDEVVDRLAQVCTTQEQQEDICFIKETCLTAVAEKIAMEVINKQLIDKANNSRKARTKKHFGEARVLTVQAARERQAQRERVEMEAMDEKERREALRGVITWTKTVVWRHFKTDFDVFE